MNPLFAIVAFVMFLDGSQGQFISLDNQNINCSMITSWYDLNGKTMANGQVFDSADKTLAAHKKLPFGTKIKLTNPQNNKSLTVTVTDRGPYIKNRDLDISKSAAEYLDFVEAGVASLEAQIIIQTAT